METKRKYDIRPLHWTFNTNDRVREVNFFKNILGMTILSHRESDQKTEKQAVKSSRTLMGYGPQSSWFAIELRYVQGEPEYEYSNDLLGITIVSKIAIARAKALNWPIKEFADKLFRWAGPNDIQRSTALYDLTIVHILGCDPAEIFRSIKDRLSSPQGYTFYLVNELTPECDPIKEVCLISSFLIGTVNYWKSTFGATVFNEDNDQATLGFGEGTCKIRFVESLDDVIRKPGYGYLTLSIPKKQIELLEYRSLEENKKLKIRHSVNFADLNTPCHVLVVTAPDDYEVVFVEAETYCSLSTTDPNAGNAFDLAIQRSERQSRDSVKSSVKP